MKTKKIVKILGGFLNTYIITFEKIIPPPYNEHFWHNFLVFFSGIVFLIFCRFLKQKGTPNRRKFVQKLTRWSKNSFFVKPWFSLALPMILKGRGSEKWPQIVKIRVLRHEKSKSENRTPKKRFFIDAFYVFVASGYKLRRKRRWKPVFSAKTMKNHTFSSTIGF